MLFDFEITTKTNMKKISIITFLFFVTSSIFAQTGENKRKRPDKEQVEAMKIAFITKKLNLSPEEAQQFWPVYNEYTAKRDALRKEVRKSKKTKDGQTEPSDAEVAKMIEQHFTLRQQELDLDKVYHNKPPSRPCPGVSATVGA